MQLYYKATASPEAGQTLAEEHAISQRRATTLGYLLWFFVGVGILLRFYHYLDNRSLWIDEVYLSTSIVRMSFLELATSVLDYQQKAPIGFLWLTKLSVLLFGEGEMALRLIPMLSGLAGLLLFVPVARYFLNPLGAVLAMGVLAMAPPLVYHAVEIKQYSTEMLATILVLYLYTRYHKKQDLPSLVLWGLCGALVLWFSFSSIFILAGMAIGLSLYYLIKKDWNTFFSSLIPFTIWLISFATNFLLFTSKHTDAAWLVDWFRTREGFMPEDVSLFKKLAWVFQSFYRLLDYPLGVLWNAEPLNNFENPLLRILPKMPLFLLLFAGVGLVYFFLKDKKTFLVLLLPLVLTFAATLVEMYPFYERLLVFLAPLPILLLAKGCERLTNIIPARFKWRYVLPLILLGWPMWSSAKQVVDTDLFWDYKKSYYREALLFIKENMREGDVVYVYWNFKPAFRFYNKTYGLELEGIELTDARMISTSVDDYLSKLRPEYSNTEGVKRIWFVYERFLMLEIGDYDHEPAWYLKEGVEGGETLKKDFSTMGKEVKRYIGPNVGVNLYDLTGSK